MNELMLGKTGLFGDSLGARTTVPVAVDSKGRLLINVEQSYQNQIQADFTSGSGTVYTAGDSVGTLQTLTSAAWDAGSPAFLDSITAMDPQGQAVPLTLLFFRANASPMTISPTTTDNAAFAWNSAEPYCVGQLTIAAADWQTTAGKSVACFGGLGLRLKTNADANLYLAVVTTGAPSYGNAGYVRFYLGFRR